MHELFKHPPATVADTYAGALADLGQSVYQLTQAEMLVVHKVVCYAYVAAVGRILAALERTVPLACNTNPAALQVLSESLQVLQEIAEATAKSAETLGSPN